MTHIGFVGDRRQPTLGQSDAFRLATSIAKTSAVLVVLAVAVGGLLLGFVVTPFHYYDAIAVVGVGIGPAVLVLAGARLLAPGLGGPLKRLDILCGLCLFCVMGPGNYLLYLNQRLDRSPAVEEVVPVRETWIRTGRHGSETFMASVDGSVASPLGRWSFYNAQPIRLPKAEWRGLTPGQSMLALRVHPGRFGFTWYEANPQTIDP